MAEIKFKIMIASMPVIPYVMTSSGTILIGTTLERIRDGLLNHLWAHRSGQWEMLTMNTVQEFAAQFYQSNPQYLDVDIAETVGEIEKALKSVMKEAKSQREARERVREHGAKLLHGIFDEYEQNDLPSSTVFLEFSYRSAALASANGKGKMTIPTKETKAAAEKDLREIVFDNQVFQLVPGKGARQEVVRRLKDENGKEIQALTSAGSSVDLESLIMSLKVMGATSQKSAKPTSEIIVKLGMDKAQWGKLKAAALESNKIAQFGQKKSAKYYVV